MSAQPLPVLLDVGDFVRLMGWPSSLSSRRKALRWLRRLRVGQQVGREVVWTLTELRSSAPGIMAELVTRGLVEY